MGGFGVIIAIIILRVVINAARSGRTVGDASLVGRASVPGPSWGVPFFVLLGVSAVLLTPAWGIALDTTTHSWATMTVAILLSCMVLLVFVAMFFAWPILRAVARTGRPVLTFRLARITCVFFATGESYAGAILLQALALAHRGRVTPEEVAALEARLRGQQRCLGTFAAAQALTHALAARTLRDEGRVEEAELREESARMLLGTITYLSKVGVPKPVRQLAYEYLALDGARWGEWGSVHVPPEVRPTKLHREILAWATPRFFEKDAKDAAPPPLKPKSRLVAALGPRRLEGARMEGTRDFHAYASWVYVALSKREAVAPRNVVNMLMAMDLLTHPQAPDTLLSAEARADEAETNALHDAIADAIAEALRGRDVPLSVLPQYGPISARVYQRVESEMLAEWARMMKRFEDRKADYHRRDGGAEWLEASQMRRLYRRVERCLGEAVVTRLWPEFVYVYCGMGVKLSETFPRMRPLAHAVFACLAREAERFKDVPNTDQQLKNMRVTAGTD